MKMLLLSALLVQSADAPKPFRARVTVESSGFGEDGGTLGKGRLWVRPGEALRYEDDAGRLVIRDGRAWQARPGSRRPVAWNAERPDRFHPVDLWRLTPAEVARRFDSPAESVPEAPPPPGAVRDREGRPRPVLRPGRLPWACEAKDGTDRTEGCRRVILVPKDEGLRERLGVLRLSVDGASGRILRITARHAAGESSWTLDGIEIVDGLEDGLFELEGSDRATEEP